MHKNLLSAFGSRPQLLDNLQMLEDELSDIDHDESMLSYNREKRCVQHKFSDDWDSEYIVLQHWSDHVGAQFTLTEEPDKKGFFSAYIQV